MKIFLFILLTIFTYASSDKFLLYDLKSETGVKATYPLKANRMYMYYDTEFKKWVYTKTNEKGSFSKPLQVYKPGTILPASVFGLDNKREFYTLKADGKWVKGGKYAIKRVIVKDSVNREITQYPNDVAVPAPPMSRFKLK